MRWPPSTRRVPPRRVSRSAAARNVPGRSAPSSWLNVTGRAAAALASRSASARPPLGGDFLGLHRFGRLQLDHIGGAVQLGRGPQKPGRAVFDREPMHLGVLAVRRLTRPACPRGPVPAVNKPQAPHLQLKAGR
jgi:hypothetical protein